MILWRYLAKEFLKFTGMIITSFVGMYCIVDFFEQNTRYFPKYNATPSVIAEYYLAQIPKLVIDVLPFSAMFGSLITLWIFGRSGEIAAMRSAGASILKICSPIITFGGVLTVLSFAIAETVVPKSALHLRYVEFVKIQKTPPDMMFHESNWVRGNASVLYFRSLDQINQALDSPEYFLFSDPGFVREFVHAERAVFDSTEQRWKLENAVIMSLDKNGTTIKTELRPFYFTNVFSQPPRLLKEGVTPDQVSFRDLKSIIDQSKQGGGAIISREVELHQKVSMRFANLIFIFFTLRFALRKERQADTYVGIAFVLILAVCYWVGNEAMRNLATKGWVNPLIAAWAVNVCYGIFAFFQVRMLDKGM